MPNFEEYQRKTEDTAIYPKEYGLIYTSLGLVNEAGEVAGKLKKLIRDHDSQLTFEFVQDVSDEMGDVLWYLARLADELGLKLNDVAQANLDKLEDRKNRNVLGGSGDKR